MITVDVIEDGQKHLAGKSSVLDMISDFSCFVLSEDYMLSQVNQQR